MTVQVLFFGATADTIGQRRVDFELPPNSIASQIFEQLVAEYPSLAKHRLHYSVNQQYATGNETLTDGDEIAIFAAVSGG
ncbi:MAG: MoaD/ThiS family protein [Blastocatellia bacterium]|nr:MoaD/ThiS family protein [Blastocatellia bacterium]